ncbi:MAG: AbiV family abortive infection protein [Streptosporangiaceae bacterium]
MDLRAVKLAPGPVLAAGAAAAAENASELVAEAELLGAAHRTGRAVSLAALAVEESGKAIGLTALAGMPASMREHAPVAKMLNWHALKQVTGQLMAAVPVRPSLVAATLLDLPAAQVDQALKDIEQSADEADLLRRRGLYVDIRADGGIYEPRHVTEAELGRQLALARNAAGATIALQDLRERALIIEPADEVLELTKSAVRAVMVSRQRRKPQAAADVITQTVRGLVQAA